MKPGDKLYLSTFNGCDNFIFNVVQVNQDELGNDKVAICCEEGAPESGYYYINLDEINFGVPN